MPIFEFGPFLLDPARRSLLRDGAPQSVTPKAFDVLVLLVEQRGRVLSKDELLKAIRAPGKIEEAFNRTMVGVSRATQGEQIPWFSSSLVEDFSFATAGRTTPDPAPAPVEAEKNLPAPRPDPDAAVRLAYQSAESAGTKKAWRISFRSIRPVATPSWRVRNLRLWLPLPVQPLRWMTLQSGSLIRKSRSIEMMLPLITSADSSMHNTAIFLVQSRISTKLFGSIPKMPRV